MRNQIRLKPIALVLSVVMLNACSSQPSNRDFKSLPFIEDDWRQQSSQAQSALTPANWISQFNDPALSAWVKQAIVQNTQLEASYQQVLIAKQQLAVAGATDWPSVDFSLSATRREAETSISTSYNSGLSLSYQVDIWGKLSATQQQATLDYQTALANYQHQLQSTIAQITQAWFQIIQDQKLTVLFGERVANLKQNNEIIKRGYELGLMSALDVYLSENNVNQEQNRVLAQQQTLFDSRQRLQTLAASYPAGDIVLSSDFPTERMPIDTQIPSEWLMQRPDLQGAWLNLLALEAGVAVAHKNRFPKLTLTGSYGANGESLRDVLSSSGLLWSFMSNLASPLFDAGRLAALEQQAIHRLQQAENSFQHTLLSAMAEVESLLANRQSLAQRLLLLQQAEANAVAAEKLAFEQYQKGLVSYTTVLDAQRRAFDAATSIIQIQYQQINNQIMLNLAMGGGFDRENHSRQGLK